MNLVCPACGLKSPIEVFAADKDARLFAQLMGRVPTAISELVLRYLGLFAPAKHAMTFGRGRAVLEELVLMIEAGRVSRARREWPVSLAQFEQGLQTMVDKRASLTLPLKTHGYLLEVLAGAIDRQEAKAEARGIEQLRTSRDQPLAPPPAPELSTEQRARSVAMAAITSELAGLKRLQMKPDAARLRENAIKAGATAAATDFVLTKLGIAGPSQQPKDTP